MYSFYTFICQKLNENANRSDILVYSSHTAYGCVTVLWQVTTSYLITIAFIQKYCSSSFTELLL